MYSDAESRKHRLRSLFIVLAAIVIVAAVVIAAVKPGRDISEESAAAIQDTVIRSARQCYVVEGIYPPDLEYLNENYGLHINTEDFYVTYEAFASNLPPTVIVTSRK